MKVIKNTKSRFRDISIFLIILLTTTYLLPQTSENDTWIVLPTKLNPYKSSDLISKVSDIKLKYPQEVQGKLLGDEQFGTVKILVNKKKYYLPVRLLLKKP